MERRALLIYFGALATAALAGCAGRAPLPSSAETSSVSFSEAERKLIVAYFEQQRARRPGRDQPAQQVTAGNILVAGQRPNRLPDELNRQLTYLPDPYARLILGADVILVNRDSHDILDVIPRIAY